MGRATEFYYYIKQEEINKEEDILYTHLTISKEIKQIRKDYLLSKKTDLKLKGDGSFNLF